MRVNVEKVLERDQKLSELDQRVSNGDSGTKRRTIESILSRRMHCSTERRSLNSRPAS